MAVYLRTYTESTGTVHGAAEVFRFPGGEVHLKNLPPETGERTVYVADVRGADMHDLMAAAMWADVAHEREMPFVLMLPYLPAARADRGEPTGKYVYSKFIETMGADHVFTIDTHSPIGNQWYRNLRELDPGPLLDRALNCSIHWKYDAIIAPDAGAKDRAEAVAKRTGLDFYVAEKDRDFVTGQIYEIKVPDLPANGRYLVVDDICDGGSTFLMLAHDTVVDKRNIDLWVTHGVFSGDAPNLRNYYRQILTTDSHPGHNRVGVATTVVPVFTYMFNEMAKELSK